MTDKTKQQKDKKTASNKLPDHVEDYFLQSEGSKENIQARELFNANEENIDLKTDLEKEAIPMLAVLKFNDNFLVSRGLKPIFSKWLNPYMRLRVSKERLSRGEFVKINKAEDNEDFMNKASGFKNIMDSKNK